MQGAVGDKIRGSGKSGKTAKTSFADDMSKTPKKIVNAAKAFLNLNRSGLSYEDQMSVKRALNWHDKAHYEGLNDACREIITTAMEKSRALNERMQKEKKIRDIDDRIEKLERSIYKAQHYGNNESGDFEASDKYEKEINKLEASRKQLKDQLKKKEG